MNDSNKEMEFLKFNVNSEENEIIQYILGNYYGCRWGSDENGSFKIRNLKMPFLYFRDKRMMYGQVLSSYKGESLFKEYDFSTFIKDYYVFKNK